MDRQSVIYTRYSNKVRSGLGNNMDRKHKRKLVNKEKKGNNFKKSVKIAILVISKNEHPCFLQKFHNDCLKTVAKNSVTNKQTDRHT